MQHLLKALLALSILTTAQLSADTLELADGTLLEGDFVGSSNGIIMFNTGEEIEAYPESDVVGVFLSAGVEAAQAAQAQASPTVTVPSGTRLVIRISDSIDSRRHQAGHRFRGQLEGALVVDGVTAAPRGSMVYGQITQANQAGRLAGSSELALEITDIMLDDQLFQLRSNPLEAQAGNEAGRTVARTARAAAIGGLIDGRSGLKTGAKVGVGASILTGGASIQVTPGTLVETTLVTPLSLPR